MGWRSAVLQRLIFSQPTGLFSRATCILADKSVMTSLTRDGNRLDMHSKVKVKETGKKVDKFTGVYLGFWGICVFLFAFSHHFYRFFLRGFPLCLSYFVKKIRSRSYIFLVRVILTYPKVAFFFFVFVSSVISLRTLSVCFPSEFNKAFLYTALLNSVEEPFKTWMQRSNYSSTSAFDH